VLGWVDEKVFGQVFVGFSSFPALTLLEVGDVLGGEGDADAVHLLHLAALLAAGGLVRSSGRHLQRRGGTIEWKREQCEYKKWLAKREVRLTGGRRVVA
jgi:hypothetical protein